MGRAFSTYHMGLFICCLLSFQLLAQDNAVSSVSETVSVEHTNTVQASGFTIRNIVITGNRKTKPIIILREIPFTSGETMRLQDIVGQFDNARRLLMNTALFQDAQVTLKSIVDHDVDVLVTVKERWYVFPMPYFKPVDRNLNEWLVKHDGSFNRVNYGVKLIDNNTTGFNDKLQIWMLNGYTKQLSFRYDRLYIDHRLRWGANIGFSTGKNREVNYNTIRNKQAFLRADRYIRNFTWVKGEITFRPAIKTIHRFGLMVTNENVKDTVLDLNPNYFKKNSSYLTFPELYYGLSYSDLDFNPYPTKGYAAEFSISQRGFNKRSHVFQVMTKASAYWPVAKHTFAALSGFGIIKAPFKQPYFSSRLLGYDDFIQGYEYYVIDGVAGGICKAALVRELFGTKFRTPAYKGHGGCITPLRVFGKIYGNAGYVYNENPGANSLSNKVLFSGGIGLDILTFYDYTIKLEWTFNQLGQNGLFLHHK